MLFILRWGVVRIAVLVWRWHLTLVRWVSLWHTSCGSDSGNPLSHYNSAGTNSRLASSAGVENTHGNHAHEDKRAWYWANNYGSGSVIAVVSILTCSVTTRFANATITVSGAQMPNTARTNVANAVTTSFSTATITVSGARIPITARTILAVVVTTSFSTATITVSGARIPITARTILTLVVTTTFSARAIAIKVAVMIVAVCSVSTLVVATDLTCNAGTSRVPTTPAITHSNKRGTNEHKHECLKCRSCSHNAFPPPSSFGRPFQKNKQNPSVAQYGFLRFTSWVSQNATHAMTSFHTHSNIMFPKLVSALWRSSSCKLVPLLQQNVNILSTQSS